MKQKQKFELLPFDDKEAYKQIANPLCAEVLARGRLAASIEELKRLREELADAGIEQGVWPLAVAIDMKLAHAEDHAERISPEVRGIVEQLLKDWRDIRLPKSFQSGKRGDE